MSERDADDWKSELDSFFNPASVAIVGASRDHDSRGHVFIESLLRFGYEGRVFPVNPKYDEVDGMVCHRSVAGIGEPVDFVAVSIRNESVPAVIEECARAGVKSGVVVGSGFAESLRFRDGRRLQNEITEICDRSRIRLCGPNCIGAINTHDKFMISANIGPEPKIVPGNVALVLQSGALSYGIMDRLGEKGVGISHLVTSGNEAVLATADYLAYLLERPTVRVVGVYLEAVNRPEKLLRAAKRAVELRKQIIVLKAGRSETGAKVSLSHTGSFVGSQSAFSGIMRQHGVVEAQSLGDFVENIALFSRIRVDEEMAGMGVAFVGPSGGAAALVSDLAEEAGLRLARLAEETSAALAEALPVYASIGNPLDITGAAYEKQDLLPKTLELVSRDPDVGEIVYLTGRLVWRGDLISGVAGRGLRLQRPLVILAQSTGDIDPEFVRMAKDYPTLQGFAEGVTALKNLQWQAEVLAQDERRGGEAHQPARTLSREARIEFRSSKLALSEGLTLLESYGIPVATWKVVRDERELLAAADRLGFPLVLKANTAAQVHKTDLGLVRTAIDDGDRLTADFDSIRRSMAGGEDGSVVVQRMLPIGVELALGAKRDASFGPVVTLGLGGIFIEVLRDFSVRKPPVSRYEAGCMMRDLKFRRLLEGGRGRPAVDDEMVKEVVVRFSSLVEENSDWIAEMDVNPLIATTDGIWAVDCRVVPVE